MTTKYKVGDKVRWAGDEWTITRIALPYHLATEPEYVIMPNETQRAIQVQEKHLSKIAR
jgi:hypothetical protein